MNRLKLGQIAYEIIQLLFLQLLLRLQIHGFGIAPIVGILLSEIALDGKASTLSTEAFRWDWFG